jgi:hypothetical protein
MSGGNERHFLDRLPRSTQQSLFYCHKRDPVAFAPGSGTCGEGVCAEVAVFPKREVSIRRIGAGGQSDVAYSFCGDRMRDHGALWDE